MKNVVMFCVNRIVLKRHMHNMEIHPDIYNQHHATWGLVDIAMYLVQDAS